MGNNACAKSFSLGSHFCCLEGFAVAKPQWLGAKSVTGFGRVDIEPGTLGRVCSFARFVLFFSIFWSSCLKNLLTRGALQGRALT